MHRHSHPLLALVILFITLTAHASPGSDRTQISEEEDFSGTPYTEYGEFNEEGQEAADTQFFQHGRFFGVSLGTGFEGTSGNRGALWKSGFPMFDFRILYWFDFNVSLALGLSSAPHFYQITSTGERKDVKFFSYGADLKYYFDTSNLSSTLSFANPHVLLGVNSYSKSEHSQLDNSTDTDNSVGVSLGGGLEFPVKHRRFYFAIEGKAHFVSFNDTYTTKFQNTQPNLNDLTGIFYTMTANFILTW